MNTFEDLDEYLRINSIENAAYLSEEETIPAIIGFDVESGALIYDKEKLVECFMEHFRPENNTLDEEELFNMALEWVEYNTIRALPYENEDFVIKNADGEIVERLPVYGSGDEDDAKLKAEEIGGTYELVHYVNPILMENCRDWSEFCESHKDYYWDTQKIIEDCTKWIKDWYDTYSNGMKLVIDMGYGYSAKVLKELCVRAIGEKNVAEVNLYTDIMACHKVFLQNIGYLVSPRSLCDIFIGDELPYVDGVIRPFGKLTDKEISIIGNEILGGPAPSINDVSNVKSSKCIDRNELSIDLRTAKNWDKSESWDKHLEAHFKNVYWQRMVQIPTFDAKLPIIL